MKTKEFFLKSTNLRSLLVFPIIFLAIVAFSLNASGQKTTKSKTEVTTDKKSATGMTDGAYAEVDELPVFPGGDIALLKYIADSTHYPKDAKTNGVQGKVVTRFMVRADGTVSDVSVLKSVSPSLDKEAIRVVSTLPKFTPGKLNGKNVNVWFMVPIQFSLK